MKYIGTIYTVGGYYYIGPDEDLERLITDCKHDIETGKEDYVVHHAYVNDYNEETCMPKENDPIWGWMKEDA